MIFNGEDGSVAFNVRQIARQEMFAADPGNVRRILGQWVRARDAEGNEASIVPPDIKAGCPAMPLYSGRASHPGIFRKAAKRFEHGGGLRLTAADSGVWIEFIASDGTTSAFDVVKQAEVLDPVTGHTLLQWCRDRLQDLSDLGPLTEEEEDVKVRIDEVAPKLATKSARQS